MALTKIFNGRRYYFNSQFTSWKNGEQRAEAKAEIIRKAGDYARVSTEGKDLNKVYIVWSRERKH